MAGTIEVHCRNQVTVTLDREAFDRLDLPLQPLTNRPDWQLKVLRQDPVVVFFFHQRLTEAPQAGESAALSSIERSDRAERAASI